MVNLRYPAKKVYVDNTKWGRLKALVYYFGGNVSDEIRTMIDNRIYELENKKEKTALKRRRS